MQPLHPLPAQFDPTDGATVRTLAWLARCGYYDADRLPAELAKVGQTLSDFIEIDGTTVFVSRSGQATVVSFRGTEFDELRDIVTDLRVKQVPFAGGLAHRGFVDAVECVRAQLIAALPAGPIWLTGHSMGGSLARILAAQLEHPVAAVVTFGGPRIGDPALEHALAERHGSAQLRVTHDRDPVLDFPPKPLGYRHGGPELRLFADASHAWHDGIEPDGGPTLKEIVESRAKLHLIPEYERLLAAAFG